MGKKLLSSAVNLFCAAAILFSLLCAWTVITTPKGRAPSLLGWSMLTVLTGSMEPALPEHSLIFVCKTDPADIAHGDIITFYTTLAGYRGVINTHRVVAVLEQNGAPAFLTKGDANAIADTQTVSGEQLVGKVVGHSPGLGAAVSFLRHPFVFLPLVLIPLLVLIFRSGRRLWRLGKEEVRRAEQELLEETHDDNAP